MHYNSVTDSFHTKKLCTAPYKLSYYYYYYYFLQGKCDFTRKTAFWVLSPPQGGLKAMYDVHLSLMGKCAVDFLLVLTELFY